MNSMNGSFMVSSRTETFRGRRHENYPMVKNVHKRCAFLNVFIMSPAKSVCAKLGSVCHSVYPYFLHEQQLSVILPVKTNATYYLNMVISRSEEFHFGGSYAKK